MYYALVILAIIVCVLLGLIILVQNPKGGGLASGFTGSNVMGVQRTGDFLEKGTWTLTIILMVLALLINVTMPKAGSTNSQGDELQKQINKPAVAAPVSPSLPGIKDTTKK
ncbi:preprotein translocase subunit SecG [Rubrolithibacter danxiaensis]|uniref:preprotein translocase subunit SecG n=1 Tax=Rubrolithibacter danxiaensis TaxID=3390805 RepID=UPI003BF898CE